MTPSGPLPAPGVVVRPARPDDPAAGLVFDAARSAYSSAAGSEQRARAILERLWPLPGHSASYEHALVVELDGRLVGVLNLNSRARLFAAFASLREHSRPADVVALDGFAPRGDAAAPPGDHCANRRTASAAQRLISPFLGAILQPFSASRRPRGE